MEQTIHTITLDLQRPCHVGALTVKKGDTHRLLRLRLLSGGRPYALSDDCYGVFTAQKPDGTVIYNACAREGNALLYQLTPQTTAAAGTLECEIKLYGPKDALLTTAAFCMTVEDTVYTQGDAAITSTGEATALTQLITQAEETIHRMEKVLENEVGHAVIDNTKVGDDAWSGKHTVDKLCPAFAEVGEVAVCEPVEGYPLGVVSQIEPVLSGSGDPSPENIRPITGQTSVTLTHCGKNLFDDVAWYENHGFTPQADGSWLGKGVNERCFTNTTKQPGSMYLTATMKTDVTTVPFYLYAYYTDGTISPTLDICQTETFTTQKLTTDPKKTVDYIQWTFGGGGAYYIKDVQISFVDDKYEPYRGDTFTLDLGQTVYGGSLDWKTGILTVEYGIQDLSALAWSGPKSIHGYTMYHSNAFSAAASLIDGGRQGWCSVFSCVNGIILAYLPNNSLMYSINEYSASKRIYIRADGIADVDALMAVLEGQKLVYQLAEPITIQLTPREILALSGTNCLYSDTGDTQVTGKAAPNVVIEKLKNAILALGGNI